METETDNQTEIKTQSEIQTETQNEVFFDDPLITDIDKEEIIKINNRIKILEKEMNDLANKIEKYEFEKREPILKKLYDIENEGNNKEKIYFNLKKELDSMTPETEDEKNNRLKDKINELDKIQIEIDRIKKEHDLIIIPDPIEKPINKSKFTTDKYNKDVSDRDAIKNSKMRLSNLLSSKGLNYSNLKTKIDEEKNIESSYDILYNKCKIAYDEYNQIGDIYDNIKKELNEIDKLISKDQFNGTILYNEIGKLYDIQSTIYNKGVFCISIDPVTKNQIITEYDLDGKKKVLFDNYTASNIFDKLENLDKNPPTYVYTSSNILLELELESLKNILNYENSYYKNTTNLIEKKKTKNDIIELKKQIKDLESKINDLPISEWIEVDKKELEIQKNNIISSMPKNILNVYLKEEKQKEIEKIQKMKEYENEDFKINNYSKSMFENYINSNKSINKDDYLKNIAVSILKQFEKIDI
jgi:hypothetical protein